MNHEDSLIDAGISSILIFSPYMQGERAPIWNEKQTGSFKGLSITHGRPEIMPSVLEGLNL
ncbi:hypothetical protein HCJ54_14485 [Listeria grandensis]|nr:hypothetical protein [Listeria grandensis]